MNSNWGNEGSPGDTAHKVIIDELWRLVNNILRPSGQGEETVREYLGELTEEIIIKVITTLVSYDPVQARLLFADLIGTKMLKRTSVTDALLLQIKIQIEQRENVKPSGRLLH